MKRLIRMENSIDKEGTCTGLGKETVDMPVQLEC